MRKDILVIGETYHIFTKSIADYVVFNSAGDWQRMQQLIKYYQVNDMIKFSNFLELKIVRQEGFYGAFNVISKNQECSVQIIAYCLMPTHLHLILKQLSNSGISNYMKAILDSYSKYFNTIHKRKGPLWESRFNSILVNNDEQLLHLSRYHHLNPVTAKLVERPENWFYSSYREYIGEVKGIASICQFDDILEIEPSSYQKFVNDRISYQRELAKIKKLIID